MYSEIDVFFLNLRKRMSWREYLLYVRYLKLLNEKRNAYNVKLHLMKKENLILCDY